jgi:hypothetical protein
MKLLSYIFGATLYCAVVIGMEQDLVRFAHQHPTFGRVLYLAVAENNIKKITELMQSPTKDNLNRYVTPDGSCTPFLKAVFDNNNAAIALLVRAGADLAFTNKDGINIVNFKGYTNRRNTMSVIINSLPTLERINAFSRMVLGGNLSINSGIGFNRAILHDFLDLAGNMVQYPHPFFEIIRGHTPLKFNMYNGLTFLESKQYRYYVLQRSRLNLLLSRTESHGARFNADIRNYILDIIYPSSIKCIPPKIEEASKATIE